MFKLRASLLAVPALALLLAVVVRSEDENQGAAQSDSPAVSSEEIAKLILQLDADEFQARQAATKKLIEIGPRAIGAVKQAAEGDSLEVTTRAIEVLAALHKSGDGGVKIAAELALKELAGSKNENAARRAKDIIDPPKVEPPAEEPADPFGILPPGFPRPKIEIRGFGAGGGMSISVSETDGNKKIDAKEGGRRTQIEKSKDGKIKMSVTETKDGKEETKKYEADSEDDLKKKAPEAYDLYKKYDKGMIGGLGIRIGGFGGAGGLPGLPGGALPGLPAIPKIPRIVPVEPETLDKLEDARKELQSAADEMRELAVAGKLTAEAAKKLAERIDDARGDLEAAQRKLGGR